MNDLTIDRRTLLKAAGLGGLVTVGSSLLPVRAAFGSAAVPTDTLVVIFLRGGADWLSLVPPVADPDYTHFRPTIAVPASKAINLDGYFALHPGLAKLKPFYDQGQLGIVHAVGSPDPSRSHFDAEYAIETGAFDAGRTYTGWLDRYLTAVPGTGAFDAVAHSTSLPQSLAGGAPAAAIDSIRDFGLPDWLGAKYPAALSGLYAGVTHPLARQAQETLNAVATVKSLLGDSDDDDDDKTYPGSDLGRSMSDVARIIKAGLGARVITVDVGGWDMHTDLGQAGGGQMFDLAQEVGDALAAFGTDLGAGLGNVTVMTVTEFGRRAYENGSGGLDHGHGQAIMLLGGGVRGGKVYGAWPTLAEDHLDQGDLAGTTDIRSVFGEVLSSRMGASDAAVRSTFPRWNPGYVGALTPR